jgi:hypothetical protein
VQNLGTALAKGGQLHKCRAIAEGSRFYGLCFSKGRQAADADNQLLYDSAEYTQPISLGVDAGSKTMGISDNEEGRAVCC